MAPGWYVPRDIAHAKKRWLAATSFNASRPVRLRQL
jgi:hypothetical protein